jgi:Nuclease-related domain
MRDSRRMTVNYVRCQQWRRLRTAASRAAGAAVTLTAAVLAASADEAELGLLLVLLSGVLALASRHALRLAARSRVGAQSESQVRRVLERLEHSGWSVQHALDWPGRGDLDHVLRSPSGMGFVIETKTLHYSRAHVVRTIDAARWLARKRRRYPCGVLPVVCVTRARRVERFEEEALVVSLDCLVTALRQTRPLRRPIMVESTIA